MSFSHAIFQLKDGTLLFDYNVQERVKDFVAAALAQVKSNIEKSNQMFCL